jgi:transcription elongation factor GreB
MSKAFLRESDDSPESAIPLPVAMLPPGARNYLTARGADGMRRELRRLRIEQRPPLAARAAAEPDAKRELAALDQRIRYLQQSLAGAEVVTTTAGPTDVVRFGTTVVVREPDGATATYRLVGVDEADPSQGAVSWISPIAQALMNARVGDRVQFATPGGTKNLTIVEIRYD